MPKSGTSPVLYECEYTNRGDTVEGTIYSIYGSGVLWNGSVDIDEFYRLATALHSAERAAWVHGYSKAIQVLQFTQETL